VRFLHPPCLLQQAKSIRGTSKIDEFNVNPHETSSEPHNDRHLSSVGTLTVLVVLVSSSAGEKDPTLNATYLQGTVFGTGVYAQSVNLISQYRSCSRGVLQLKPATGTKIKNGVLPLQISGKVAGGDIEGALQTTILNAVTSTLKIGDIRKAANHVMVCLPTGMSTSTPCHFVNDEPLNK
jgi:hypothetical protein